MLKVKLKILDSRVGKDIAMPKCATLGSAGFDLCACIDSTLTIRSNETELINTGVAIFIEDNTYAGIILPRSGLGHKHGIVLGNGIGLIDSDYQGELKVSCWNRSKQDFILHPGDRFAQLIFTKVYVPTFEIVTHFSDTERGTCGFGSTGIKETV